MKLGTGLIVAICAVVAVAVTYWVNQSGTPATVSGRVEPAEVQATAPADIETAVANLVEVEPGAAKVDSAQPKAVADSTHYNFGEVFVYQEGTHNFKLTNEGDATLKVLDIETTCKCTLGSLKNRELPPGETTDVEMSWVPKRPGKGFLQTATLHTNDPNNRELRFQVEGDVRGFLEFTPSEEWDMGEIREDTPSEVTGHIYTAYVENFEISDITSEREWLTGRSKPMTEEQLKVHEARAGYEITAVATPEMAVGYFTGLLRIDTDIEEGSTFAIPIVGRRQGPVKILPMAGSGWSAQRSLLGMGEFPSALGKTAKLSMFVDGLEDSDFKITDIDSGFKFLNVTAQENHDFKAANRKNYVLTFEIPPGAPPAARLQESIVITRIKTNQPSIEEIQIQVQFVSR